GGPEIQHNHFALHVQWLDLAISPVGQIQLRRGFAEQFRMVGALRFVIVPEPSPGELPFRTLRAKESQASDRGKRHNQHQKGHDTTSHGWTCIRSRLGGTRILQAWPGGMSSRRSRVWPFPFTRIDPTAGKAPRPRGSLFSLLSDPGGYTGSAPHPE